MSLPLGAWLWGAGSWRVEPGQGVSVEAWPRHRQPEVERNLGVATTCGLSSGKTVGLHPRSPDL